LGFAIGFMDSRPAEGAVVVRRVELIVSGADAIWA
jgi:hypothetical protein